jgi:hypothetical protein
MKGHEQGQAPIIFALSDLDFLPNKYIRTHHSLSGALGLILAQQDRRCPFGEAPSPAGLTQQLVRTGS